MNKTMMERIVNEADYIILTRCTVRHLACRFGISKTTAHTDISHRLKKLDTVRYEEVRKIMEHNIRERTFRGGESTRNRHELKRYTRIA